MRAADPVVTFLIILVIGILAGIIFDRVAGPSWLTRQFAGSTRGIMTSSLIGIAGAFIGFHLAGLFRLSRGPLALVIAVGLGAAVVLWLWRMVR
jgi:uncharacterized membrane protein YeaQ/YmgE (transglycosylase-associated protein family)